MPGASTDFDVVEATIAELHEAMVAGRVCAETLVEIYLDRIERFSRQGSRLNAVRETDPTALATARRRDQERRRGHVRSVLHGIPVLVKDSICTGDSTRTTFGAFALRDLRTPFEAATVSRLREAGAIVLGKCSCTDFGDYVSSVMPAEHSTTGGVVSNPYGVRYGRGAGSSTGVAAAVAANLAVAGIGSEAHNSTQGPAVNTSLVGIKPTVGLLSARGDTPLVRSHTTAGVMARTVRDGALLLRAMTVGDANGVDDPYPTPRAHEILPGRRLGVARAEFFARSGSEAIDVIVERAIDTLRAAGADIVDPADIESAAELMPLSSIVFKTEFKIGLNELLARCGGALPVRTLRELIEYNERFGDDAIPYGQDLLIAAEATAGDASEPRYHADRGRDVYLSRDVGIDLTLQRHALEAIIVPMDHAAKLTGKAGYPAVSVPCGFTPAGAPVGLTFIGTAFAEARLLALAGALEELLGARKAPAS